MMLEVEWGKLGVFNVIFQLWNRSHYEPCAHHRTSYCEMVRVLPVYLLWISSV
jgi:hypothetical protein